MSRESLYPGVPLHNYPILLDFNQRAMSRYIVQSRSAGDDNAGAVKQKESRGRAPDINITKSHSTSATDINKNWYKFIALSQPGEHYVTGMGIRVHRGSDGSTLKITLSFLYERFFDRSSF